MCLSINIKLVRESQQNSSSFRQIYNSLINKNQKHFTVHSLESGPNSELHLPDGHWIFEERGGWSLIISLLQAKPGYGIPAGTWAHASKVLNPKLSPAHGPGNPRTALLHKPYKNYGLSPLSRKDFSCQKNYCIQRHCGMSSLSFFPLGNRFWHHKNGIAMETSRGKNFSCLYGKDVLGSFWQ